MSYVPSNAVSSLVTADGQTVALGKKVRLYNAHIISGGTGGVTAMNSGGATGTGTAWVKITGTANTGTNFNFGPDGILFPNGLYVDVDSNTTSVALTYSVEL